VAIGRLVVVAGAGASTEFGVNTPMPLMPGWAAVVCRALHVADPALPDLVGISEGQSGPEFEAAIGQFLAWRRVMDLASRFLPFGLNPGFNNSQVSQWEATAESRARLVVETLNTTMYEQFGGQRVNTELAAIGWGHLLRALQLPPESHLTVATTNYDPSVERALAELELKPEIGAVAWSNQSTALKPEGLIQKTTASNSAAVLHLHGKVGWYTREDSSVLVTDDNQVYDQFRGTPTVLMPDPDKNPLEEPAIRSLWQEFRFALGQASHVVILGHSLHDPALVREIAAVGIKRAICVLPQTPGEDLQRMAELLPGSTTVPLRFGVNPERLEGLTQWVESAS
jgi:SIR2-like domain